MRLVLETNAIQSFLVFVIVVPVTIAYAPGEAWPSMYSRIQLAGRFAPFFAIVVGMFLARPLALFSTCSLTAIASGILPRLLGGPRRVIVILVSVLSGLPDELSFGNQVSAMLMLVSLGLHLYASLRKVPVLGNVTTKGAPLETLPRSTKANPPFRRASALAHI
ncbi:Sugar phosphate transporter domain-containing protein [Plasmodiophora brassicae]